MHNIIISSDWSSSINVSAKAVFASPLKIKHQNDELGKCYLSIKHNNLYNKLPEKFYINNYSYSEDFFAIHFAKEKNVLFGEKKTLLLNLDSLLRLNPASTDFVFFGFSDCLYLEIACSVASPGSPLQGYCYSNLPTDFAKLYPDTERLNPDSDKIGQRLKHVVASTVVENAQRIANEEAPITFVFCVEYNDGKNQIKLNPKKVATSRGSVGNMTDMEMRCALKLMGHPNVQVSTIAKNTFKLVSVEKKEEVIFLQEIKPFYQEEFISLWAERRRLSELKRNNIPSTWSVDLEDRVRQSMALTK